MSSIDTLVEIILQMHVIGDISVLEYLQGGPK